jgi:hypothetical protein
MPQTNKGIEIMKMKSTLTALALLTSASSFAGPLIVGDYMSKYDLPEATCRLDMINKATNEKQGVCSATLVSNRHLITAKHCIPGADMRMEVTCESQSGKTYKKSVVDYRKSSILFDSAVIKLAGDMPVKKMKVATNADLEMMVQSPSLYECALFGYGIDNEGKTGTKHGVRIDTLKVDEEYYLNSHLTLAIQDYLNKPEVMKKHLAGKKLGNPILTAILNKQMNGQPITEADVARAQAVPEHEAKAFSANISKILSAEAQKMIADASTKEMRYVMTTQIKSSKTPHKSGMLPGDSGGTMACKGQNGEYILVGINSNIQMAREVKDVFGPIKMVRTVSKIGAAVPVVHEVRDFVDSSMRSMKGSYSVENLSTSSWFEYPTCVMPQDNTYVAPPAIIYELQRRNP